MPELPEIETIKRVIGPQIKGLTIQRITINRPEVIAHPASDNFCRQITGQIFTETRRRGKFLILCMDSGDRLVLHLRMTGCLLVTPADYPKEYLETKGQDYRNTPFLQVYGHGGKPCPVCGEILCRTVIGGRSSVYCPACQK